MEIYEYQRKFVDLHNRIDGSGEKAHNCNSQNC